MNIEKIEKKENKLLVTVAVPSIERTKGKRILITTGDVEQELKNQNVKFGPCENNKELWNTNPNLLSAVWVFENPSPPRKKTLSVSQTKEETPSVRKPSRPSRTSRKIKKSES